VKKTATTTTVAKANPTATAKAQAEAPRRRRGPANIFGAGPHKHTLTATVLDCRGGTLETRSFRVSGEGHRAMEAWALGFGPTARWGIEGASGLGRHTAMYLAERGHDVRDCSPNRTNERRRARNQGKTDASDSLRIARETQADPAMPRAFKRAEGDAGPDETAELLALWHKARRSLLKSRQHILNEAENLLCDLPLETRELLPRTKEVKPRLVALGRIDRSGAVDAPTRLRLELPEGYAQAVAELDAKEKQAVKELARLTKAAGSTLDALRGISTRSAAELLVETGDPRRFCSEGGFARFNGTAPIPASSAEGDGQPVRHRLNRGGNRRVNAVLHIMAVTQLRYDERARRIFDEARHRGHTKKEAMRVLKRHLSDVVYRHLLADFERHLAAPPKTDVRRAA
jgi:transposase